MASKPREIKRNLNLKPDMVQMNFHVSTELKARIDKERELRGMTFKGIVTAALLRFLKETEA